MGLKKENVPLAALLHFINSTAMTTERTEPIAATFQPSTYSFGPTKIGLVISAIYSAGIE